MNHCFHCEEPIPEGADWSFEWNGSLRQFCCAGCHAIAKTLVENGLDEYYRRRTAPAVKAAPDENAIELAKAYQDPNIRKARVITDHEHIELHLYVEGIRCSACVWLIEKVCLELPAVIDCQANAMTHRVLVKLTTDEAVPMVLERLQTIGYRPHVIRADEDSTVREDRALLKRLGVAGLVAMQTMMFAVGLYVGDGQDMAIEHGRFLRWTSALLACVVVFYAAAPFFRGAWQNLQHRRLGMDVPVALAIGSAWLVSMVNTVRGDGEVYFDSVAMFTFFLLLGRYLLLKTQLAATESTLPLSDLPDVVQLRNGRWKAVEQIVPDDEIVVPKNGVVAADGILISREARVNEAILTGEPWPQKKVFGHEVYAGSRNEGAPFMMRVTASADSSFAAKLQRYQTQAMTCRNHRQTLIDKIAHHFVAAVLLTAVATFMYWWITQPDMALESALAVLVVSCPCALSLAAPAAQTATLSGASQQGLLIKDADVLESLVRVSDWVFDKTGTLTTGQFVVQKFTPLSDQYTKAELDHIVVGLQRHSEHPVARAMTSQLSAGGYSAVEAVAPLPERTGMQGRYQGKLWVIETVSKDRPSASLTRTIQLRCDQQPVAEYQLGDAWRPDAKSTLAKLKREKHQLTILTGDPNADPKILTQAFAVDAAFTGLSPEEKVDQLKKLKTLAQGSVAMVGDGLNDAPVLAQADVSLAFASGAMLSRQSAQILIVSNRMKPIWQLVRWSQKCHRIIRQNITWALIYNAISIPAAAAGQLPPWLAAIGMSTSSLLVVSNALRARRLKSENRPISEEA